MESKLFLRIGWLLAVMTGLTACSSAAQIKAPTGPLTITLLYPSSSTQVEMGQTLKGIVRVTDTDGKPVENAHVILTISDPTGKPAGNVSATFGDGDVYRTEAWQIPHRMQAGRWTVKIQVEAGQLAGSTSANFQVDESTSEILLEKYGFWLEAPTMRGIVPNLVAEKGNAQNGLIRWGGALAGQHVLTENWVEVQWRQGQFELGNAEEVRQFLLRDLGDLGFTPIRELGPFEQTQFKHWKAWLVKAQGEFYYDRIEWMVFYAPEVDKTYAIGTTVVNPLSMDANAQLRASFEVDATIQANGQAPEPLPRLLPGPELISPALGQRFFGLSQPIILKWKPVKELAGDEYYQVTVMYNYDESNLYVNYATRDTQFTLPEELYKTPNCHVFNWSVSLMRQTELSASNHSESLSYKSLYWYVEWYYPPDQPQPFKPLCPNPQK